MRRSISRCLLATTVVGCADTPLQPNPQEDLEASARAAVLAVPTSPVLGCTRSWAAGVDGDWNDPAMWTPVGVPVLSDSVCITAPGTYTVTLDVYPTHNYASITTLRLGGLGSSATLVLGEASPILWAPDVWITGAAVIAAGSELVMDGDGALSLQVEDGLNNDGIVSITGGHYLAVAGESVNNGTIEIAGNIDLLLKDYGYSASLHRFVNVGTIDISAPERLELKLFQGSAGSRLEMAGGTITGTQYLDITSVSGGAGVVTWSAGTFDTHPTDSDEPLVTIRDTDLILASTGLSGRLGLVGSGFVDTQIVGDVGSQVTLSLRASDDHLFRFRPRLLRPTSVTRNEGTITVVRDTSWWGGFGRVDLTFPTLINTGDINLYGDLLLDVQLSLDSLVNEGAIELAGDVGFAQRFSRLRNDGTMTGGTLTMQTGTRFDALPGSTHSGSLTLANASLFGDGVVGDVIAVGGSIQPGADYGAVGTLTASSVDMQGGSGLVIEIADTAAGSYDQLVVAGGITYGGTLSVRPLGSFQGGSCGQAIPIVLDGDTGDRGAFSKYAGMTPGLTRHWRLHSPPGSLQIVGFNPLLVDVFKSTTALTVAEGAPGEHFFLCLGPVAPTADVSVNPRRTGTEIEVAPGVVTFPVDAWQLPRRVTVVALNDSDVEGDHADGVSFTVTSSDPGFDGFGMVDVAVTIIDNDVAVSGAPKRRP